MVGYSSIRIKNEFGDLREKPVANVQGKGLVVVEGGFGEIDVVPEAEAPREQKPTGKEPGIYIVGPGLKYK